MDDSDNMLFTSLLEMKIKFPASVACFADIKTQQLQSIIIQMLQLAGCDTTSINQLNKAQKFRVATKLNQQITKRFNTQFDLNDLMSSNINVIRKILVTLMSKMSMVELDPKNNQRNFDIVDQEDESIDMIKRRTDIFKSWTKKQWVRPQLLDKVRVRYNGFQIVYDIQGDDFAKKNILQEIGKNNFNFNLQQLLADNVNRNLLNIKRREESQGMIKHQVNDLQQIKNKNKEDWNQFKTNSKKLAKGRKKLIEIVEHEEKKQQAPTIFQQQVQQLKIQTKQKQLQKDEQTTEASINIDDPLSKLRVNIEEVKKQHEKQISRMNEQLQQRQDKLDQSEQNKNKLEQQVQKKQQLSTQLQQKIQTTKVQAQKLKRVVDGMNSPQGLEGDISKLKDQIKQIQNEANAEINSLKKQIKQVDKLSKQNLNKIQDVKLNLTRIQDDYVRIIRQIADNQKKKGKITLPTQGIARSVYNKKIYQNQSKLKESKQQIIRMTKQVKQLQQSIIMNESSTRRIQIQIDNLLRQDTKKYQDLQNQIKTIFTKYKQIYNRTMTVMKQISKIKQDTKDQEMRVRQMANKNYKQTIQKLNSLMSS